uniref:EF-hand domain-containing protein n=1 Tax=Leersia perrieri TaxID=77586 RepID=A0A0D9WFY0_9ORYZ
MGKMRAFFSRKGSSSGSRSSSSSSRNNEQWSPRASDLAAKASLSSPAALVAAAVSSPEETERIFSKFDANGDGRISRAELAALFESVGHAVTDDEVARMMQEADADGDGYISLGEFAAISSSPANDAAAVEEDLRHAFGVFDADGNGVITPAELARVLRGIGEAATVAQCRRMIDGVDRNGDGLINFEEFKLMMAAGAGCFGKIAS